MSDSSTTTKTTQATNLTWVAKLSLAQNRTFVWQMGLAFIIPLLLLGGFMLILEWPPDAEMLGIVGKIVLLTGGIILVLYLFVIVVVLRGRQEIKYTLDPKGILEETAGPLKYINVVRILLLLSGRPTYMGMGLATQGPTSNRVTWGKVKKVITDPDNHIVTLRKGRTDLMTIHCTPENYAQVSAYIQRSTSGK